MSKPMAVVQRWARVAALAIFAAAMIGRAWAAEVIPGEPTRYFNDYALAVKPATADKLNAELEDLEKTSSNQILVAVFASMQTDSAVDDYCLRIFRAWKVGQKDKNNGAVLFVFLQNHKLWIQTGKGLEGALPDAVCKDITADTIAPRFKQGDYDGGLTAGVEAMIAAAKGEYKGDGQTDYQKTHGADNGDAGGFPWGMLIFFILLAFFISRIFRRQGGTMFTGGGPTYIPGGFGGFSSGGGGFGGGGSSGGGSSSGGGFFSSGGGDTGGGGAGSDW